MVELVFFGYIKISFSFMQKKIYVPCTSQMYIDVWSMKLSQCNTIYTLRVQNQTAEVVTVQILFALKTVFFDLEKFFKQCL